MRALNAEILSPLHSIWHYVVRGTSGKHHILIWDLCSALALAVAILDALALEMAAYRYFGFGGKDFVDFGWNCFGALSASMPKNLISYVYCSVSKKLHKYRCCKLECCFTSMIIYMLLI